MPLSTWATVTVPQSKIWPINFSYNYHCGNQDGFFGTLDNFISPLDARYGKSSSAEEFTFKSQMAAYESHRAMFEGYNLRKYNSSTGVIQWMLNNAWPGEIWHLYDYYLQQGGSFFGSQKANGINLETGTTLHIMYNYQEKNVWVYNSVYQEVRGDFEAFAQIWDVRGKQIWQGSVKFNRVHADAVLGPLIQPYIPNDNSVYFLRLGLKLNGKNYRENVYWLTSRLDVLDWKNSTWWNTPVVKPYADFTGLQQLKKGNNVVAKRSDENSANGYVKTNITLTNFGPGIEFAARVRLVKQGENPEILKPNDVLPIVWSDNYVTIFPDEVVEIQAVYLKSDAGNGTAQIAYESWNTQVSS